MNRREGSRSAALLGAGLLAGAARAWLASRRFSRYAVSGESMAPTIRAGDWLLADAHAYRSRSPLPGDVVLASDPRNPDRTLVKRVSDITSQGSVVLVGDNAAASTDSRSFGPVPPEYIQARVALRYWPRPRLFKHAERSP